MDPDTFEPKILAFCCHYCAYASADLAGSMRLQMRSAHKLTARSSWYVPMAGFPHLATSLSRGHAQVAADLSGQVRIELAMPRDGGDPPPPSVDVDGVLSTLAQQRAAMCFEVGD